jgi:hypothetical protein
MITEDLVTIPVPVPICPIPRFPLSIIRVILARGLNNMPQSIPDPVNMVVMEINRRMEIDSNHQMQPTHQSSCPVQVTSQPGGPVNRASTHVAAKAPNQAKDNILTNHEASLIPANEAPVHDKDKRLYEKRDPFGSSYIPNCSIFLQVQQTRKHHHHRYNYEIYNYAKNNIFSSLETN